MSANLSAIQCFLWSMFLALGTGSQIVFEKIPAESQTTLSSKLSLYCSLKDTGVPDDVQQILSMIVIRNEGSDPKIRGKPVAAVNSFNEKNGDTGNLQVKADVSGGSGAPRFIELTWTNPTLAQTGKYLCEVNAIDGLDRNVVLTASLDVIITKPTMEDVVSYIHGLDLATECTQNSNVQLMDDLQVGQQLRKNLTIKVDELTKDLNTERENNKNLTNVVYQLQHKINTETENSRKTDAIVAQMGNKMNEMMNSMKDLEVKIDSTKNTTDPVLVDSNGLSHIETGYINCGNSENWTGREQRGTSRFTIKPQAFKSTYKRPPVVHLSIRELFDYSFTQFNFNLVKVDEKGFEVKCKAFAGTRVTKMIISWISFAA